MEIDKWNIVVDEEEVGQFFVNSSTLFHRGRPLQIRVKTTYEAVDIFHSFYGQEEESLGAFCRRCFFVPAPDENMEDVPF